MFYRVSILRSQFTIDAKNGNKKIGIIFDIKKQRSVWCINQEDEIDKREERKKSIKGCQSYTGRLLSLHFTKQERQSHCYNGRLHPKVGDCHARHHNPVAFLS
jgi:hypothetical protein